jgi:hypothetical protein
MAYIDVAELTVRIAESCMGNRRPLGLSAEQSLAQLREMDADTADGFRRAALAAAEYVVECCNESSEIVSAKILADTVVLDFGD